MLAGDPLDHARPCPDVEAPETSGGHAANMDSRLFSVSISFQHLQSLVASNRRDLHGIQAPLEEAAGGIERR